MSWLGFYAGNPGSWLPVPARVADALLDGGKAAKIVNGLLRQ
jgi:hypothetical protein